MVKIILASSSPSRQSALKKIGLSFEIIKPDIDETPLNDEAPINLVKRLSQGKAKKVNQSCKEGLIIAGDQILECGGRILGKPHTHEQAIEQLLFVSGQSAVFQTGICLINASTSTVHCEVIQTYVTFESLSIETIENYLRLDKPYKCAGSIRFESAGILMFSSIQSIDPSAITGMPYLALKRMLAAEAVTIPHSLDA